MNIIDNRRIINAFPLISCCTLTYKNFLYIYDTLKSVLDQDYPNIEIIISDDGSSNFPRDEIEEFLMKTKKSNIVNVIILAHKENKGTVKNYNSAIRASTGDYIFPLSCGDVLYDTNVFSKAIDRFLSTGLELISFRRQLCEEKKLNPIRLMPTDENIIKIKDMKTPDQQFKAFAGVYSYYEMASGSSTCFRKSFIESFGLFDEDYRLWEDGPLFTRYTRNNNIINTAYDIIYIKYRYGGISTNNKKNSPVSIQLKKDAAKMVRKEVIPFYGFFSFSERRIIDCNCFCYEHYDTNKIILALIVLLRWPELFIKRFRSFLSNQ